jgi:hypothetical protein
MVRVTLTSLTTLLALGLVFVQPLSVAPDAQTSVYFRSDFNTPGSNNSYGFEGAPWAENGNYARTHLATGGWNGSGAGHIRLLAGREQYNLGWSIAPLGRSFAIGDTVYIRFRIRYDDSYRWAPDGGRGGKNKFILMGQTGTSPNSRIIIYQSNPNDSQGCTLGQVDYINNTGPFPWATTQYFGLSGSWFASPNQPNFGSIEPYVNINGQGNCAPPALVTYGNRASPPAPGPNSATPVNGWYHVQIQATSGGAGQGGFRMWVNNNNFNAPTSVKVGLLGGLGVTGWGSQQIYVGGYVDNAPSQDLGFRIDDVEIGGSFDPAYSSGSGGGTAPPAPPLGVRIVG